LWQDEIARKDIRVGDTLIVFPSLCFALSNKRALTHRSAR
jgi:hypothetical protein